MKNIRFAVLLIFALSFAVASSGCVNSAAPQTMQAQQAFGQICASYTAVMKLATAANNAGKLNDVQRNAITTADAEAFKLCTGPTPADINGAITKITAAITTISINAIVNAEKQK